MLAELFFFKFRYLLNGMEFFFHVLFSFFILYLILALISGLCTFRILMQLFFYKGNAKLVNFERFKLG